MAKKKLTIDDIFNDDDFGLLDYKVKTSTVKTDEERLIDSFEEIYVFIDKNKREPCKSSMSEYSLLAKLKNFRENEEQKKVLKPGLGGHLPGDKVTPEIAKIRGLKVGEASASPGRLSGSNDLNDLIDMVAHIKEITGGKPIGIKFASGRIEEDIEFALKAKPDFITIDCRGGTTGSSPKF